MLNIKYLCSAFLKTARDLGLKTGQHLQQYGEDDDDDTIFISDISRTKHNNKKYLF